MVAVKMGDEDVVDEREMYVSSAQLQLCAFATIYHKEFVANSDNLWTCIVAGGRQCWTTTQYVYFERFHGVANLVIVWI